MGGDFNTTPNGIKLSMGKWLERIGGEVCAPGNLTCKNGKSGGRTIDFFIVDSRIPHGVKGTWCQMDVPTSPHYMVVLRISSVASRATVRRLIAPRAFEPRLPIGCQFPPVIEKTLTEDILKMTEQTNVNDVFGELYQTAERHLCRAFDKCLIDGEPDPKFVGRSFKLE